MALRLNSANSSFFTKFHCLNQRQAFRSAHVPVMLKEVVSFLSPSKNDLFIDMTFGGGGHTKALLEAEPSLRIICLDRDPHAYTKAVELAKDYPNRVIPRIGKFSELPGILSEMGLKRKSINGMLFDVGCSSDQLDIGERGFSISNNGPLDMRMDGDRFPDSPTALDILNNADEIDLMKIFKIYGEEKQAKKIARLIVENRYSFRELKTTKDLALLVQEAATSPHRLDKLQRPAHVATKIFQALRIFVNNELNELNYGMILADWFLNVNGRLVTLSFHSLEDRIIKRHLTGTLTHDGIGPAPITYSNHSLYHAKEEVQDIKESNWMSLTKHVVVPTPEEVEANPRSRSAKLRAAIKIK